MSMVAIPRSTLPERFFPLPDPAGVDRFLDRFESCAVFKAATNEKTFDAWFLVQQALEPRADVAVGLIQIPAGRAASEHIAGRTGISHKSPQFLLFRSGSAVAHLDEKSIQPEPLAALLREHLPSTVGGRVVNDEVVSLEAYRSLLAAFVAGTLPEERFQWAYLDRLQHQAEWRDDDTFALLTSLFDFGWTRHFTPAHVVAHEFQGQLADRLEPLRDRAARLLARLAASTESV
jgi:bacillithiol system protein YtxJ